MYDIRHKPFQLLRKVISLIPSQTGTKVHGWKHGTKIFFTANNQEKALESLMIQTYGTISPSFNTVASIIKTRIKKLNERNSVLKSNKFVIKHQTIISMLIHFMQKSDLLPLLTKTDLEKLMEFQLSKNNSNFSKDDCERNLLKIDENQGEFNRK